VTRSALILLLPLLLSASDRKILGQIDFFGGKGFDGAAIRSALPFHEGDSFPPADVKHSDDLKRQASLLLMTLTKSRDPKILALLRAEALDSLLEMARWRNLGHAAAALSILGRIAGIDEASLEKLIEAGHVDTIVGEFARP